MPATSLPRIPIDLAKDEAQQQIIISFNQLADELDYLLGGFLDSKNAREFGGWQIGLTELQSKDKTVGMSTNKNGADPIRLFAGDKIGGQPKFKVTNAGILTAIAGVFMSALGYPKIAFNQNANLLQAFSDANNHVDISPSSGGSPGIAWYVANVLTAYMNCTSAGPLLASFNSTPLTIQPATDLNLSVTGGNVKINGSTGYSGSFQYVKSVSGGVPTNGTITVTKGLITNVT